MQEYIAHINEITGEVQSVKEHSENTAKLCEEYSIEEMKDFMRALGLLHDVGKYQSSFVKRINGANIRVEHSICGALAAEEIYPTYPMRLMMQYCIAGHHTGIPDGGFLNDDEEKTTLSGRLKRPVEDFSKYKEQLSFPLIDEKAWAKNMVRDCDESMEKLIDKFAFFTRYAFSCLVDADSRDTADFCQVGQPVRRLKADFNGCLSKVEKRLDGFKHETELQKTRILLQQQAFKNAEKEGEIYLLNMPTGSGKTLASVKIALRRAILKEKKRIIYIIPYNSIIEQTAQEFENTFGEEVEILRHQSTYSYEEQENNSEDYRDAAKSAIENWDAPFIITTAVQFFESIYANKRGKLRKLHNMSDSILIFDEAHLMPIDYLQPCLQAVSYITRYLNSEALFLTATMPDFGRLLKEYAIKDSRIINLIEDTSQFAMFQKCRYCYLGEIEENALIQKSRQYPSSLIIVNQKKTARELFLKCTGKKYCLSTYLTSFDRKRILEEIREELKLLSEEYPDFEKVPEDRRITIISTTVIEAGVDLDVYTVFRERAGLDHILQAGGRCNREGRRPVAEVFIFDLPENGNRAMHDESANLTKGLIDAYEDISDIRCIKEFYDRFYFIQKESIQKNAMHNACKAIGSIPFKQYAEKFELIDSATVSLVVPQDENAQMYVEQLKHTKKGDMKKLQNYSCSIRKKELEDLFQQHAVDDFGTGIFCLTNSDYYSAETGISFEAPDYII